LRPLPLNRVQDNPECEEHVFFMQVRCVEYKQKYQQVLIMCHSVMEGRKLGNIQNYSAPQFSLIQWPTLHIRINMPLANVTSRRILWAEMQTKIHTRHTVTVRRKLTLLFSAKKCMEQKCQNNEQHNRFWKASSRWLLWTRLRTFGLYKKRGISWLLERSSASQDSTSSSQNLRRSLSDLKQMR
jgi:hypothetical protein